MNIFFLSPEAATLLGLTLLVWFLVLVLKSIGRNITVKSQEELDADWEKFRELAGPMTWGARIFAIVLFALVALFAAWLATIT
ncbi:MAG: hypothetical protein IJV08_03960 [Bacteroidaceae bacterium]|nr:hypothetical protein [Bacteroidaceae bacterium]